MILCAVAKQARIVGCGNGACRSLQPHTALKTSYRAQTMAVDGPRDLMNDSKVPWMYQHKFSASRVREVPRTQVQWTWGQMQAAACKALDSRLRKT